MLNFGMETFHIPSQFLHLVSVGIFSLQITLTTAIDSKVIPLLLSLEKFELQILAISIL